MDKPELSWKWLLKTGYEENKGMLAAMKYLALIIFCAGGMTLYYFSRDIVTSIIGAAIGTALIMVIIYITTIIYCSIISRLYRRVTGEDLKL